MTRIAYLALAATFLVAGCMSNGTMTDETSATAAAPGETSGDAQEGSGVESQPEADEIAEPTTGY